MSNRVPVTASARSIKSAGSIAGTLFGVLFLTGCASFGSLGVDSSLTTASTGTSVEEQLDQAMPGTLQNNSAIANSSIPRGPYLPPGSIGGSGLPVPIAIAAVSSAQLPAIPAQTSAIVPGVVNSVTPQSTSLGSQQTMPAQNQTAIAVASATQPIPDSSVPRIVSGGSAPTLTVVPQQGYQHIVESGESLYAIARRYNVKADDIVQANGLRSADQIFVGQKITIPGREDLLAASATQAAPQAAQTPEPARVATIAPATTIVANPVQNTSAASFRWPVNGRVIVDFEQSRRTGINIEAPEGAAVKAAEDGTVIYVGDGIEGFGNLILVRHANGFVSAYAHLKGFNIAKDAIVRRGDQIGTVGTTGSVNRPQLHFELRRGATPVDPMPLLAT